MPWTDTQTLSMAVMFLVGAALVLLYDLGGIATGTIGSTRLRRSLRPKFSLWDFLVWLIAIPLVFIAALACNQGELRFFVFVGLATGVVAYLGLGRPFVITAGGAVVRPLRWLGSRFLAGLRRRSRE